MEQQIVECEKYLNETVVDISQRINTLNDNLNSLKNDLFTLTKQYETSKQASTPITETPLSTLLEEKINELMALEHEDSITFINTALSEYVNEDRIKLSCNEIVTHDVVNTIQGDCEQHLTIINNAIENIKANRHSTMNALYKEMLNEFTTIQNLLSANYLDVLESNNDKANAIQDMLRLVLGKFKVLRQENKDFEEKIVKLIDELCTKMAQMKL